LLKAAEAAAIAVRNGNVIVRGVFNFNGKETKRTELNLMCVEDDKMGKKCRQWRGR
jgi:hypothetical protein